MALHCVALAGGRVGQVALVGVDIVAMGSVKVWDGTDGEQRGSSDW